MATGYGPAFPVGIFLENRGKIGKKFTNNLKNLLQIRRVDAIMTPLVKMFLGERGSPLSFLLRKACLI